MDWVNVEERLPRKGVEVLVVLQRGEMRTAIADKEYAGGFRFAVARGSAWFSAGKVTHWAKKPEMPNAALNGAERGD